jgi:hypothetical protein
MTCDAASNLISLYYYGELEPADEDLLETHLAGCSACAAEVEKQRKLAAALDRYAPPISPHLLEDCRADLMAAIAGGAPRAASEHKGPWTLFLDAMASTFAGLGRLRQPLGATAFVALGFMAAKITPGVLPGISHGPAIATADLGADVFSTVRSVKPDSKGRVQIAYDETHRQVTEGRLDDPAIQRLLLTAAHEQDAAVRGESVGVLTSRSESTDVRDALLNAVAHDSNAGVRLKALEGLKPISADPLVRKTLAQVLLTDDNARMRMEVADLLVAHCDDSMVGTLQSVMQREDNDYVRMKVEKALKERNASIATY